MRRPADAPADQQHRPVRVDRRVAETKELVLQATYDLISELGFAGATVERIAERSGVARSSVYRHWPSPLPALHLQALAPLTDRPDDVEPTGDFERDALAYLDHVVDRLNDPRYAAVSLALLAVADTDGTYAEEHRQLQTSRTRILHDIIGRAVESGTLCRCTAVDFEVRMLLAPLTHMRFVEHHQVDRRLTPRLVARVVDANRVGGALCTCPPPA